MRHTVFTLCLIASASVLSGCEALGIETATEINAKKEAEGMAVGGACRHAVRSIEDCFSSYPKSPKSAVFAGWKEMDQYMRDNEILGMPSQGSGASGLPDNTPAADAHSKS